MDFKEEAALLSDSGNCTNQHRASLSIISIDGP